MAITSADLATLLPAFAACGLRTCVLAIEAVASAFPQTSASLTIQLWTRTDSWFANETLRLWQNRS